MAKPYFLLNIKYEVYHSLSLPPPPTNHLSINNEQKKREEKNERRKDLSPPQSQHPPPQKPIHSNNANQDPHPLARPARGIAIRLQHARSPDLALGCEVRRVHAGAACAAVVDAVGEFVDHHSLEDVGLVSLFVSCSSIFDHENSLLVSPGEIIEERERKKER